ncbi:MAG: rRNA methyltransferase [Sphingobacteriaceae bacterium]|nr:rRNA methyltransferase [Sphingobacteriaceae bacterium]
MSEQHQLLQRIAFLEQHISEHRLQKIKNVLAQRTRHLTVVLENLYHPENGNAVMRSVECFGLQEMQVIQEKYDWKYSLKIARGAAKWTEVQTYGQEEGGAKACYADLRVRGYQLVATDPQPGSCTAQNLDISRPVALIFGTESTGVAPETLAMADARIHIPMVGFTESFNISVSAGILLAQLRQRLEKEVPHWQLNEADQLHIYADWLTKSVRHADALLRAFEKDSK